MSNGFPGYPVGTTGAPQGEAEDFRLSLPDKASLMPE